MPHTADDSHSMLISASGLACERGDRLLWRHVSLAVAPGDALWITGSNGVGKSSLLRVLAGLLAPVAGDHAAHGAVALFDERHALDVARPLRQSLAFWAGIDGREDADVDDALRRVALAPLAEAPLRILSTGQRKRAALARLLLSPAPVWLLDEPANGLDDAGVAALTAMIATHRAGGGAVVLASHQPLALPDERRLDLGGYSPA